MFSPTINKKESEKGSGDTPKIVAVQKYQRDIFPQPINNTPVRVTRKEESLARKTGKSSDKRKQCSKSMTDLFAEKRSQQLMRRVKLGCIEKGGERMGSPSTPTKSLAPPEIDQRTETGGLDVENTTAAAARRVQTVLILHAWRRRRLENKTLQDRIASATTEVESLKRQLFVVRQLLESEKQRGSAAGAEVHKALKLVEEKEVERLEAIKAKTELDELTFELEDHTRALQAQLANSKNELATARAEAASWEQQLNAERDKLSLTRETNEALQAELERHLQQLDLKTRDVQCVSERNKELQEELDQQMPLWQESLEKLSSLREMLQQQAQECREQRAELEDKETEVRGLQDEVARLQHQMTEQQEMNALLGKCIVERTDELSAVQRKLELQVDKASKWPARVAHAATLCSRVPSACLYTMAMLLLPRPLYRGF